MADVQTRTLRLKVPAAEYENSLRRGLILSAQHPIRHSGPFQFRVSVADAVSDRVGAASQFVEVPDLVKGGLAMSGILLMGDNAAGTAAGDATTGYSDGHAAIRRFQPGDRLRYQYKVLNANAKDGPPELESALLLYRDGVEVFRSQPRAVSTQGATDASRLLLGGDLKLPASFTPGDYALQLMVRDRRAPKGKEVAASSVDFELTGAEEAGR